MKYKIKDFYKKDRKFRIKCFNDFWESQWDDVLLSYLFIALSSSQPIFSLTNGAIWVFLWYTLSVVLSLYIFISQSEYNDALKRGNRFSKKHPNYIVEKRQKFSGENGGWNSLAAQLLCAIVVYIPVGISSLISQIKCFDNYMDTCKDFYVGIFVDTYILTFCNIYYKGIILDIISAAGWKNKIDIFLHTFQGSKKRNLIMHIVSLLIMARALMYYFTKEFSGLFNPVLRTIMGFIYILYLLIDVKAFIKKIYTKIF